MGGFLSGRTSLTTVNTSDIADNAVTLAKMASGTASQNIAYDGSGDPVDVALSSAGWAFVENVEASTSSTIVLGEGNIDTGFDYMVQAVNVDLSADLNMANAVTIQYGTGGGPTYAATGYISRYIMARLAAITSAVGLTTGISWWASNSSGGTGAGELWSGEIRMPNPAANELCLARGWASGHDEGGTEAHMFDTAGWRSTGEVITGFRLQPGTGSFTTGSFNLFKKANA